ncbi:MAG: hypothetical protein Q9221_005292 [Calogaya cf. arnoldii]
MSTLREAFGKVRKEGEPGSWSTLILEAFLSAKQEYPNQGKARGMSPRDWWATVIRSTFSALLPNGTVVPEELIASLFRRFSSSEGYRLYDDVMPFFRQLHEWRSTSSASRSGFSQIQVGIISNSDGQRVASILDSFGIGVNRDTIRQESAMVKSTKPYDIDWVVASFDSGFEKPCHKIFDVAKALSASSAGGEWEYLHVGDSITEDYHGALAAGWQSVILDRDGKHNGEVPETARVANLTMLMQRLIDSKKS